MRHLITLAEQAQPLNEYVSTITTSYGAKVPFSSNERAANVLAMLDRSLYGELRGLAYPGTDGRVFWWDGAALFHNDMEHELKREDGYHLYMRKFLKEGPMAAYLASYPEEYVHEHIVQMPQIQRLLADGSIGAKVIDGHRMAIKSFAQAATPGDES